MLTGEFSHEQQRHFDFQGPEGGSTQKYILGYACMVCHSFVIGLGEDNKRRVMGVIPDVPQQVAVAV